MWIEPSYLKRFCTTPMNDETSLIVGLFTVEEVTEITRSQFSSVLQEAARALEARGQPLWSQNELTSEALRKAYPDAEMVLGYWNGEAVAGMVLVAEDPAFWPDTPAGESLFVHKLAVVPKAQGKGIAAQMLAFAQTRAYEQSKRYVRLDTAAERPKVRAFYEKQGFIYVGEHKVGTFDAALYEKKVAR